MLYYLDPVLSRHLSGAIKAPKEYHHVRVTVMSRVHQISIVDSNSLSSEGIKHALSRQGFNIVNRWKSVDEAIECAPSSISLDAILINQPKQALPRAHTVSELRKAYPGTRLALIGESDDPDRIRDAIKTKFDGFIRETIEITAFPKAIQLLILGEPVFPPLPLDLSGDNSPIAISQPPTSVLEKLSASELRVLALISNALANKVIARDLGISEATVKVHVKAILRKTGSRNRTDAALLAQGLEARSYLESLTNEKTNGAQKAYNFPNGQASRDIN